MGNCLILLTNYYPFYKGEEYLESEIEHLAAKFDRIFIISTMVSKNMKPTRIVPKNAVVLPVRMNFSWNGKVKMFLSQFRSIQRDPIKKEMIKKDSKGKILNRLYCTYFESRAMAVYKRIEEMLSNYDFDRFNSIIIYSYWFYITARVAVELKRKYFSNCKPYTFSRAHGYDINEHVNILKYLPERNYLLKYLDNVFPVSQNGVDFLREKYTEYANKVDVRRLGTKRLGGKKQNSNNFLHIVSCSTVRKLKRIDLIIEALEILQYKKIKFKWTHIGGGPDYKKMKRLAMEKLDKNSFFFTGHLRNDEVLNWYQNNPTTVFVNTSTSEGVPVSIMEAMSMSIPVIATNVGGTKEIVKHEVTGYLLDKDCTKNDLAKYLMKIKSMDRDDYETMCERAYNLWQELCDAEKIYNEFTKEIITIAKRVKKTNEVNLWNSQL